MFTYKNIVISTQVRENYAAHNGFTGEYRWKYKGGETYIIRDLTLVQVEALTKDGLPESLVKNIESRSDSWEEYIIDYQVVDSDVRTHEEWETPFSIAWESGRWIARRTIENGEYGYMRQEIEAKTEQYDMLPGGERANYTQSYLMRDGREMTYEQLEQFYSEAA